MKYKDLVEFTSSIFTESGLKDNLLLDLCLAKTDTNIRGRLVNISVIVPDEEGDNQLTVSKYFDYAMRNTLRIMIGEPNFPVIIDEEDIRSEVISELKSLHPYLRQNILKDSFLKIYEIISPLNCYHSIAPKLQVEIEGL